MKKQRPILPWRKRLETKTLVDTLKSENSIQKAKIAGQEHIINAMTDELRHLQYIIGTMVKMHGDSHPVLAMDGKPYTIRLESNNYESNTIRVAFQPKLNFNKQDSSETSYRTETASLVTINLKNDGRYGVYDVRIGDRIRLAFTDSFLYSPFIDPNTKTDVFLHHLKTYLPDYFKGTVK